MAERRIERVLPDRVRDFYADMPDTETRADERLHALVTKRAAIEAQLEVADDYRRSFDCYIAVRRLS